MNDSQPIINEPSGILQSHPEYEAIHDQILAWTNGHPILTRYLWEQLSLLEGDPESSSFIAPETVNQLVRQHFSIHPSRIASFPDPRIQQLLSGIYLTLMQGDDSASTLQRYQEIYGVKNGAVSRDDSIEKSLINSQLVAQDPTGKVQISNLIFRKVFNQDWLSSELKRQKSRNRLDKYHLALLAGLLSILLVSLGQYFLRSPYRQLAQCNGDPVYNEAIEAKNSLDERKVTASISALKAMMAEDTLPEPCRQILYDLQYDQAIYLSAGIDNTPLRSVEILCEIPPEYFQGSLVKPWFSRWLRLYQKTDFPRRMRQYLANNSCPSKDKLR